MVLFNGLLGSSEGVVTMAHVEFLAGKINKKNSRLVGSSHAHNCSCEHIRGTGGVTTSRFV